MECLDANVVQDLMSGALDSAARIAVLGHLDTCVECRELLTVSARDALKEHLKDTRPYGDAGVEETVASDGRDDVEDDALAATVAPDSLIAKTQHTRTARPAQGRRFGRYQLLERLGAGAMGVVWRAEDPELGRNVAVKLLKRPDAALTERLVREARSMAQVNHPNVVAVYDVGVTDGATYIAMELVQGQSLRAWQAAQRHTVPEIVQLYVDAGRGLAAAHAAGLVHRDFKPDNVLVGDDSRIRVTDFGLAAARPNDPDERGTPTPHAIGDVNLTTSGSVLGTPAYMAPEQFASGNVDSRTDQFNFCVALYEALYSERPFEGRTFEELGKNVADGKLRAAPVGSPVSGTLRAILVRGMSVKPGDRYPTMDHLLAELGRDRARPWRVAAIACASVAAALALGLVADLAVRSRVEREIRQAFRATGAQIARVGQLQARRFQGTTRLVGSLNAILDVTSHRDQADFGLGSAEQDNADRQLLHEKLLSQDWSMMRDTTEEGGSASEVAVLDYKGRLLFSSAAPGEWGGGLGTLPAMHDALAAGKVEFMTMVAYDAPVLAAAHVFGATPRHGLAVMFARSLQHNDELGGVFLQFVDGNDLLAGIKLDETRLGLIAPDGTTIGDVPAAIARAAPASGDVGEVAADGATYQVQARPLEFHGQAFASVVMARQLDSVIGQLFPRARTVFAIAALGALAAALATALRARRITGARV